METKEIYFICKNWNEILDNKIFYSLDEAQNYLYEKCKESKEYKDYFIYKSC